MFCEECGTKNEKDSAFCLECGHKLKTEKKSVEKVSSKEVVQEKKPMNKSTKIIIIVVVALIAVIFGVYTFIGNMIKPEKVAEKYFKAYTNKDANALYEVLNLKESKFVSKKLLEKSLKDADKIKVDNYKVKKDDDNDSLNMDVIITYVEEGSSREKRMHITLTKKKSKKMLFFDDWSVDGSALVAKDYTISVPKDGKVKVDDVELPKKYKQESYSSYSDTYKIPSILIGNHKISVELKSGIKLNGNAKIRSGSYGSFTSNSLTLEDKTKKLLEKDIKEKVTLLYSSILEDKSFEDISNSFDEDYRDDISYEYNNVKSGATSFNKLKSIKIKDVKIKSFYTEEDGIRLTVQMKYDYKIEYETGDETKEYSRKNRTNTFYVDYKYKKKNYVMKDISSLVTYFSRY